MLPHRQPRVGHGQLFAFRRYQHLHRVECREREEVQSGLYKPREEVRSGREPWLLAKGHEPVRGRPFLTTVWASVALKAWPLSLSAKHPSRHPTL
jgi:hypothetical protein